jgi:hypothetical protein
LRIHIKIKLNFVGFEVLIAVAMRVPSFGKYIMVVYSGLGGFLLGLISDQNVGWLSLNYRAL